MNEKLFYFFHNLANKSESLDKVFIFFTDAFLYITVVSVIVFLCLRKGRNLVKDIIFVFLSGGLAWALSKLLKEALETSRPLFELNNVYPLIEETGYAFPSGHTMPLAAIAFAIFFLNKKAGYIFMLCSLLVGISRIIAGVHYPIDILGGFILGALVSFAVNLFFRRKS